MTAPQQFSPDGQWWWDGTQWVPAQQAPAPAQQYVPYGAPPQPAGGSDGKAIASLILSILWIGGIGSLIAIILGHLSRSGARKTNRQPSGVALAGVIIGYIGLVGAAVVASLVIAFGGKISHAIQADDTLNSISDAESNYHDTNGQYTGDLSTLQQYGYHPRKDVAVQLISATSDTYCFSAPTAFGDFDYISQDRSDASSDPC